MKEMVVKECKKRETAEGILKTIETESNVKKERKIDKDKKRNKDDIGKIKN